MTFSKGPQVESNQWLLWQGGAYQLSYRTPQQEHLRRLSSRVQLASICPKLFDSLSEVLCWILTNTHKLLVHLLDDFLTVSPPSSPPAHGLTTLSSVFFEISIPPYREKMEDLSTLLEFLSITIDMFLF